MQYDKKNRQEVLRKKREQWHAIKNDSEKYARHLAESAELRLRFTDTQREERRAKQREYDAVRPKRKYAHTYWKQIMKKYGLTREAYESMVLSQGGVCAICQQPPKNTDKWNNKLHVDHDHRTGKIRQLLCHFCNKGVGSLGDDVKTVAGALEYLRRHLDDKSS